MTLQDHIGKTEEASDCLSPAPANALCGLLDSQRDKFREGNALPPQWHWLYFLPNAPQRDIGTDGHPKLGGFMPDTGLPRRMFAGARVSFKRPLILGQVVHRQSQIISIDEKNGSTGRLVFVTVAHEYDQAGSVAFTEEQTIVYREAASGPSTAEEPKRAKTLPKLDAKSTVTPDTVTLFRYSALTYNAHRIHYDRDYAVNEEFYPDLVVHGPLTAILLLELFHNEAPEQQIEFFEFRGTAPFFVNRKMTLGISRDVDDATKWQLTAFNDKGVVGQKASVTAKSD